MVSLTELVGIHLMKATLCICTIAGKNGVTWEVGENPPNEEYIIRYIGNPPLMTVEEAGCPGTNVR